jgi:hypothetical protein
MTKNVFILSILLAACSTHAAEIQHSFSSPAFSGVGYSSHVLTIKQLEDQQKDKNKAAADAIKAKAEAAAANTPQAQFTANLQSRIYSQLAKQITDSLFGTDGVPACSNGASAGQTCGETLIGGNTITWRLSDPSRTSLDTGRPEVAGMILIDIQGNGSHTWMYVPSGTFGF